MTNLSTPDDLNDELEEGALQDALPDMTSLSDPFPSSEGFVPQAGPSSFGKSGSRSNGQVTGKTPPHSLDSEQSVLGAILLDNEIIHNVIETLQAEDFYRRNHQIIFENMLILAEKREPIDIVTLTAQLRATDKLSESGGVEYISLLVDIVPTALNTPVYARIVKEMALRRKVLHEASEIVSEALSAQSDLDSFIDSVEQRILQVADSRVKKSLTPVSELVKGSIRYVEQVYVNKGPVGGIPSGFTDLDTYYTHGFQPGDLVIIAARPSMGKTALALSIARHVGVDLGKGVAVFSLEMSKEQIVLRMLCSEARVSNSRVRAGKLQETDFPRLVDSASKLASASIFVDDTAAMSVIEMRAKCRRLHREKPLSMIVVDYLQLMRGSSKKIERREQEISEISRGLKGLAKELGVPVLALSQLNRSVENRQDKKPIMADLRESGAIEQDADVICFIYRDEVYHPETADKGIAELIIAKHRNGPIGTVRLGFQGEHTRFENLAQEEEVDYLGADLTLQEEDELI